MPQTKQQNDPKRKRSRRRFVLRPWHVVATFVGLIMVVVLAASSYFVWDRWYRYDDELDIQGQWYVLGTSVPIQVYPDSIHFTEDTSYEYTLDPDTKSITFWLGNRQGQGHYRFADGRQVLIITDGDGFTRWGTAQQDLFDALSDFADMSMGKGVYFPYGDDIIALSRTPDLQSDHALLYTLLAQQEGSSVPSQQAAAKDQDEETQPEGDGDETTDKSDGASQEEAADKNDSAQKEEEAADDTFMNIGDIMDASDK